MERRRTLGSSAWLACIALCAGMLGVGCVAAAKAKVGRGATLLAGGVLAADAAQPINPSAPIYLLEVDPTADEDPDEPTNDDDATQGDFTDTGQEPEVDSDVPFPEDSKDRYMDVKVTTGQTLRCVIPSENEDSQAENIEKSVPFKEIEAALDKSLRGECFDLPKGWWNYQFCYKSEITQIHPPAAGSDQYFIAHSLGKYEGSRHPDSDSLEEDGQEYVQIYTDGQKCDETQTPRSTTVVFKCHQAATEGKRAIPVFRVEEIVTCQYRLEFYSEEMCKSDEYRKRNRKNKKKIKCRMAPGQGHLLETTVPTFGSVWDWF